MCLETKSVEDFPWADRKRGFRRRSCRTCYAKVKKPISDRYYDRNREQVKEAARDYHALHRDTQNRARRQRWHATPIEERRRRRAAATFAITVEQYDEMLARQGGVCAICQAEETQTVRGTVRGLSVDHDHETGRVRGLLCNLCNGLIGFAGDDPAVLASAIDYLKGQD